MTEEMTELVEASMGIILNAGDARLKIKGALNTAKQFQFQLAKAELEEAKKYLVQAHQAQTKIIQNEARGHAYEHSLLFTHAQDTIMTIMSEMNLAVEIIDFFEIMSNQLRNQDRGLE